VRTSAFSILAAGLAVAAIAFVAAGCGGDDAAEAAPAGEAGAPTAEGDPATEGPPAQAAEVVRFEDRSTIVEGFFDGAVVEYFDFGPIQLTEGNTVAPIWVVTNGTSDQKNVIDTVPGHADYSPLWQVNEVTFVAGVEPRTLRSADEISAAADAGEVTIVETETVVNCPVTGFDQPEVLGFARGDTVAYYDLGPVELADGNAIAPIWAVTNGVADQKNIIDTVPGDADYTPLWGVIMVTFADGVEPYLLTSAAAVEEALAAGDVTLEETDVVVNCPVL
jgi:hypothetical protein